jgi:signal recognition particle subunit SRP54
MMKDIDIDDDAFKGVEAIIHSMTPQERAEPALLNGRRKERVAKGSGTSIQDVNKLMKQFDDMRKMMKLMGNKQNMEKLMQNMPKMGPR